MKLAPLRADLGLKTHVHSIYTCAQKIRVQNPVGGVPSRFRSALENREGEEDVAVWESAFLRRWETARAETAPARPPQAGKCHANAPSLLIPNAQERIKPRCRLRDEMKEIKWVGAEQLTAKY